MINYIAQIDQTALQEQISNASSQQEEMLQFVQSMQSLLTAYLPFMIAGVGIFALLFLINAINKMRVDKAILRIDKNLQKILDNQNSQPNTHVYETHRSESSPTNTSEDTNKPKKGWYE